MVTQKEESSVHVLVHMPTDRDYHYCFVRSLHGAIMLMPQEGKITLLHMCYKNIVGARNLAAKYMADNPSFTHLLFLDSDMEYHRGTLPRLLQHDKDIVAVSYSRKLPPYTPCAFRRKAEDGNKLHWFEPQQKLEPVDAAGTGGMLIKREVFDKISKPYFIYEQSELEDWNTTTEDISFCLKCRDAGIEIFVDGTLTANHITDMAVVPSRGGAKLTPVGGEQRD